ncbi:MAG: DnaJ domain-containing protein, partial [Bacteroidota bacterium]
MVPAGQKAGAAQRRRRLSSGKACLEDEETLDEQKTKRAPLGAHAESNNKNSSSSAEVAEMYRVAIKMASENKITTKNAWSLSLIDHMSEIVEDSSQLVNFQKASCALEAGVKIYCGRVDDTFDATRRVLEALHSRQKGADADQDPEAPAARGRKKKGSGPTLAESEASLDRKKALQHHPDRGGDTATMARVAHAYGVLSDATKRRQYDKLGGRE